MQRIPELFARMAGDEKHEWAAASTIDVLWVLYDQILNVTPATVDDPDRDRFLLSKGHGPMAYYAVLAEKGFIDESILDEWTSWDSPLGQHPDRVLVPGVEISSGSLGHGLPIAVGTAIGQRVHKSRGRTFVLVGDGELDEGSNHEAIAVAARLNVANLTAIVIDNRSAMYGWPGGIARRFAVEGWQATEIDGRDHEAVFAALTAPHDRPYAVVAKIERSY
ncbi:thiamine pyrophosphate-dependent enzyme [Lentzea sp. BCCO 10_0856]|uniref:Thiamine pyrophosphate-dependent enzyme n=1 Tax=Lentzea miocenica TaxID=3095431 RepID=A0ABU4T8G2_9PSEU|nr:thiamine pyrophosphate-dependent enzyme [Lentzea sp. BCCO 10_0856]MDX8034457.1 thiamine pyrophosphate-dependent enzyme [Lentzea sp. BCCO 10_0856]